MCNRDRSRAPRIAALAFALLPLSWPGGAHGQAALTDYRLEWAWSVAGDPVGLGGLEAVDLDGDGHLEILTTGGAGPSATRGGYWYVLDGRDGLVEIASSLPFETGLRAVAVGGDLPSRRIVALASDSVTVYEAATRDQVAQFPIATTDARAVAVADLDGDGALEAAICDPGNFYLYDLATGAPLAIRYGFGCVALSVGQTDADPQLEIALAGNTAGGFVLDGVSLTVDWADVRGFGNRIALGDFDGDGLDEIASNFRGWDGIRVQDPVSGATFWELDTGWTRATAFRAADLDPSPGAELLWGAGQWDAVHVVAGATGSPLWQVQNPEDTVTAIAVGDVDDDGVPEVLWGAGWGSSGPDRVFAADGITHQIEARTEDLRPPIMGLDVGDLDGDGLPEVAGATLASESYYFGGVLFEVGLRDGRLVRATPTVGPGSFDAGIQRATCAQLDLDAPLEVCAVNDYSTGGALACYDGLTLSEQWRIDLPRGGWSLRAAEIDADPVVELLVGTYEGYVYALEGENGTVKWQSPDPPGPIDGFNRLRIADADGDGALDVLAGYGTSGMYEFGQLSAFDSATGAFTAGPWSVPLTSTGLRSREPGPGQELLLGNGVGEVAPVDLATGVVGPPIAAFSDPVDAFAIFDVNRDGVPDVVAASGGRLRVFDGQAGAVVWTGPFLGDSAGWDDSLLVGDFDGDTIPDILVTTDAGVALFEAPLLAVFADGFESGDTGAWSHVQP